MLGETSLVGTNLRNAIVVDGLPHVGPEKFDKLKAMLTGKLFSGIGTITTAGFYMPYDENTGKTKGFCFIAYSKMDEAEAAVVAINRHCLDKSHRLSVNSFDDISRFNDLPETYNPVSEKQLQPPPLIKKGLHYRLIDKAGRDQFCVRISNKVEVCWNDAHRGGCYIVYERDNWTETYIRWSPQGTFLVTMHKPGIALWGGHNPQESTDKLFQRAVRLEHKHVALIDFSQNEEYVVSWAPASPQSHRLDRETFSTLRLFCTRNGLLLHEFNVMGDEFDKFRMNWPLIKWAGGSNDQYFAKLSAHGNGIDVYQLPDMRLLDGISIKMDNVQEFSWSPSAPIIAAYQRESENHPARIILLNIPGKDEIRQKNLFNVSDVTMFWHPAGSYLAVKVDQLTKSKRTSFTTFQIFRIKEKDCPFVLLELPRKCESIVHFYWEPLGSRFCVVQFDGSYRNRPDVSFFDMEDLYRGNKLTKPLVTLENKSCHRIYWSPKGKNLVLMGFGPLNGVLEFFNVDEVSTFNIGEHFNCTDVLWDPTGRYVATITDSTQQLEHGYTIWSFSGKQLYKVLRDGLQTFIWRPRPVTLLNPEQDRQIHKGIKQLSRKFEEQDQESLRTAVQKIARGREDSRMEYEGWSIQRSDIMVKRRNEATKKYLRRFLSR
jgi:translation initiation factor 3 subunit B